MDEAGRVLWASKELASNEMSPLEMRPLQAVLPEYAMALNPARGPWQAQNVLIERQRDGQTVSERLWLCPLESHALLIITDESRLQHLENTHVQTVRLASLGFLLAGACHEISNPLTAISSTLQLLRRPTTHDPAMLCKGLEGISTNVDRILEITAKLRGFSRAEATVAQPCVVDRLIEDAIGLVHHERSFGAVTLEHHKDPEAVVWCNAHEMQQVFFNVLANAVQAMEGTGRILITTRRLPQNRVEVMLQDDGPGIRPEHLSRLFEPFFSTKPIGQGTGLGLTISNELVRQHNGTLRCESTLGKGARFYVDVPLWSRP